MDPRSGDTTFEERRVRHRGLRGANNEVSVGDGRAMAWRVSARVRRWLEVAEPIGGDASFEERGADSERKLAQLAVARSAPPWAVTLCTRIKKGPTSAV